jgi:hypothetical protein
MADMNESRRTLARLTARNVEIARALETLRSKRATDESKARDGALQQEFEANEAIINGVTREMAQSG